MSFETNDIAMVLSVKAVAGITSQFGAPVAGHFKHVEATNGDDLTIKHRVSNVAAADANMQGTNALWIQRQRNFAEARLMRRSYILEYGMGYKPEHYVDGWNHPTDPEPDQATLEANEVPAYQAWAIRRTKLEANRRILALFGGEPNLADQTQWHKQINALMTGLLVVHEVIATQMTAEQSAAVAPMLALAGQVQQIRDASADIEGVINAMTDPDSLLAFEPESREEWP